ncbi:MAG: hypothetical protein IJT66_02925, partial [Clostridia bacterium]|nr:hypothetical protein [Clostridia bacterium]
MLKKLYRYECYSLFRSLVPIYLASLGFALLSRLSLHFYTESSIHILSVFSGLITAMYGLSIAAVGVIGIVVVVTRFYKNLLRDEGYLTFSLPFTPTQHILCKLLCGVLVMIIDVVVVLLSLIILGIGTEAWTEFFQSLEEAIHAFLQIYTVGDAVFTASEIVLLALVGTFQGILMFYAAIAIGQQFKSRVGGAVIAYICFYAAVQIINSLFFAIFITMGLEQFDIWLSGGLSAVQILLLFPLLEYIVLSVVYFFI